MKQPDPKRFPPEMEELIESICALANELPDSTALDDSGQWVYVEGEKKRRVFAALDAFKPSEKCADCVVDFGRQEPEEIRESEVAGTLSNRERAFTYCPTCVHRLDLARLFPAD